MFLNYEQIYNRFFQKINDVEFFSQDKNRAYQELCGYLHAATSGSYVRTLFTELKLDDDILRITYEMKRPSESDDEDYEFLIELFACGIVVEWLTPRVKSTRNIEQFFGGHDQKFYSQSPHIAELRGLLEDSEMKFRKMITERGYINNPYVAGEMR